MWLTAVILSALAAAALKEEEERRESDEKRRKLHLPPLTPGVSSGTMGHRLEMALAGSTPIIFEIDDDRCVLQRVFAVEADNDIHDGHGNVRENKDGSPVVVRSAMIEVTMLEDGDDPEDPSGEDREYIIFESEEMASLFVIDREWNEFSVDRKGYARSFDKETLICWAVGEYPPGYNQNSLFDYIESKGDEDNLGNTLNSVNGSTAQVSIDSEEDELASLVDEGGYQRLSLLVGFEPKIAYQTN